MIYIFAIPRYVGENINALLPLEAYQLLRPVLETVSVGLDRRGKTLLRQQRTGSLRPEVMERDHDSRFYAAEC
jgi:hypothetical protein